MEKESYSIPNSPKQSNEFQKNTVTICTPNVTVWGISADFMSDVIVSSKDYDQKSMIANNRSTQSPAATASRDASWSVLKPKLIKLYNNYLLNNDAISASDKQALNIYTITMGGASPYPAPTTTPVISFSSEQISVLNVIYSDSANTGSHAKPDGVALCEIWSKVDGPAPATPDDCDDSNFITRSHDPMLFDSSQRGKMVYAYARWVNRNGKTGPWSGMITAIIP